MDEIVRSLREDAYLMDLGSAAGSFDAARCRGRVIRVDREAPPPGVRRASFVQADAAALPFPSCFFEAVIANHSLEHFEDLDLALGEIGRVIKPAGVFYAAVPGSTTLTDRLYRWLARGGGHVNPFSTPQALIRRLEAATGLKHVATRYLLTSFSFLNSRNRKAPAPRKLWLLGGGNEFILTLLAGLVRLIDRIAGTSLAVYGWASWFGAGPAPASTVPWANVCVRCGSGHPSAWLEMSGRVRLGRLVYQCPECLALNFFLRDEAYADRLKPR